MNIVNGTSHLPTSGKRTWWKDGVVYQIWPASYKDSNSDGMGDIPGIISTLDYLKDLGIDIVWVSPFYDSPQHDMGYDISDYEDIYHAYGTRADAEKLIKECHDRGMRVIFDLVVNHTSHLHKWFEESRSSKDNPKRDWYIWRPAKIDKDGNRKPPNNWRAHWGGSAWEWDESTQEYYLHLFAPEQPDLNWENPVTREAIYGSAMRFWLDRGVDGFRIDTVNMYSKGNEFPDAEVVDHTSEFHMQPNLFCNGPRMHEFLQEMNSKVLSKYDCMTVGELPHTHKIEDVLRYVSATSKELDMVFQFDIVDLGQGKAYKFETVPYDLRDFKRLIDKFQHLIEGTDAWSTAFLENHDQARSISRYASDSTPEHRIRSGKLLAILLATLTGTLYIYQGQEIGMVNVPTDWPPEEYKDIESVEYINMIREQFPGDSEKLKEKLKGVRAMARDNARTPVQWDDSPHAGFTASPNGPWMSVNPNYTEINVKQQSSDPSSTLNFWKQMLKLRKEYIDLFGHGRFEMFDGKNAETMYYIKMFDSQQIFVALSFTGERKKLEVPRKLEGKEMRLLVGNVPVHEMVEGELSPFEGRVYLVE
ncbi:MAG: hypothetical protein MMC33_001400 [Icmadophila ericetorum]|nr:hypothetical protein [Icmadophila ericetorum]